MCMTERKGTLVVLFSLALGASAMQAGAQELVQDLKPAVRKLGDAQLYPQYVVEQENPPLPKSDYWIGVRMATPWLPEQTKAQLGLEHGLMVQGAMEDSPAAKAGLKQYDILLKAGDTPLQEPADLINAVNAAKESTLSLTIFRGGTEQTIDITPVKREEAERKITVRHRDDVVRLTGRPELAIEIQKLEQALNELKAKAGEQGAEIVFARPAIIADAGRLYEEHLARGNFPEDLTVRIEKEGDQPAKVFVKRGDKEWQTTENELGKLPEEERRAVLKILRHGPDGPRTYRLPLGYQVEGVGEDRGVMTVPGIRFQSDGKVRGRLELRPPPVAPAPPTAPMAPQPPDAPVPPDVPVPPHATVPSEAPAAKAPPAERSSDAGQASQELLQVILKKLEENQQQGNKAVEQLQRELKQLRSEIEQLRGAKQP